MATTTLRPMSTGEILDASFALLRHHVGVFFGIAIICQGVPTAVSVYVEFAGGASQHFGLYLLGQVLSGLGYLLVSAASIRVVSQAYLGHDPSMGDGLNFAFSKLGRTLSAALPAGILVVLGLILFIVPGIVVACGLAVAVQAPLLEPLYSGSDGIRRSWTLTAGFKWRVLGLYCVVVILFVLLLAGIGIVAALAAALFKPLLVPAAIAAGLVFLFVYPFTGCVFTLLYYDLRVRKEAFDLELLSRHLGIAARA